MSKLYLECYSGISGDMTVGALLDLGADREELNRVLQSIPAGGFRTAITTVLKSGVNACDFDVILDAQHDNHDHDMEYLYGGMGCHSHEHPHDHDEIHDHEHPHDHDEIHDHEHPHDHEEIHDHEHLHDHEDGHSHSHGHHHEHRSLSDAYAVIDAADMDEEARILAKKIFRIVAEAEAKVHGKPLEEVHFHEVGAIDSIVDIIAIAVCYENLRKKENITEVIVPILYEGCGTVRCQHGILPIPVPAVTAIAADYGLRFHRIPDEGEFVTPTGAAAVAALATTNEMPKEYVIRRVGLGAGKRAYKRAGVVRAMLLD